MNQLATTTVDAVDAFSSDASALNSRVMHNMQIPNVRSIERDNGEQKFRNEIKMATDAIHAVLDKDIQNQRSNLDSLKSKFAEGQTSVENANRAGNGYLKMIQDRLGNIDVVQFN